MRRRVRIRRVAGLPPHTYLKRSARLFFESKFPAWCGLAAGRGAAQEIPRPGLPTHVAVPTRFGRLTLHNRTPTEIDARPCHPQINV
jgi:hypothetical protein